MRYSRIPALVLGMGPADQTRVVPVAPTLFQYSLSALLVRMNQMNGPTRMKTPGKNHRAVRADREEAPGENPGGGGGAPRLLLAPPLVQQAHLVAQDERRDDAEDDRDHERQDAADALAAVPLHLLLGLVVVDEGPDPERH